MKAKAVVMVQVAVKMELDVSLSKNPMNAADPDEGVLVLVETSQMLDPAILMNVVSDAPDGPEAKAMKDEAKGVGSILLARVEEHFRSYVRAATREGGAEHMSVQEGAKA